jgi:hypothetical protein
MKKNKKLRRIIRKGLLILSVIVAMVLFVLSAMQMCITNPIGMITMFVAGAYIITFWCVNDEV